MSYYALVRNCFPTDCNKEPPHFISTHSEYTFDTHFEASTNDYPSFHNSMLRPIQKAEKRSEFLTTSILQSCIHTDSRFATHFCRAARVDIPVFEQLICMVLWYEHISAAVWMFFSPFLHYLRVKKTTFFVNKMHT